MADLNNRWCVLRISGPRTLVLADSLAKAGLEVWTPRELKEWRKPRSKAVDEREVAIMPTFVFVRSRHIHDLVRILAMPVSPHPRFSIFQFAGRVPEISDGSMAKLMAYEASMRDAREARLMLARRREEIEAAKQARKVKRDLTVGAPAGVVDNAAFQGVTGIIESTDGRDAWIKFGSMVIQVDAWQVLTDMVQPMAEAA